MGMLDDKRGWGNRGPQQQSTETLAERFFASREDRLMQFLVAEPREEDVLQRAAYGTCLIGHGTSHVDFRVILRDGTLRHTKGSDFYGSLGLNDTLDTGDGLFVPYPELTMPGVKGTFVDRRRNKSGAFESCADVATKIGWIVLPELKLKDIRAADGTFEALEFDPVYLEKLVSYKELAEILGKHPEWYHFNPKQLEARTYLEKAMAQCAVAIDDALHGKWASALKRVDEAHLQVNHIFVPHEIYFNPIDKRWISGLRKVIQELSYER